jgi:hypothetical protein
MLPKCLEDKIEKVQKRAFRKIYPATDHEDAFNTKDRIEHKGQRSKLNGKTTHCLPTVNAEIQEGTIGTTTTIYINESLTAYRRRSFGKINAFKNANNYKFI